MKIGILSDTHNNTTNIKKTIEIFNLRHVDMVCHAGDFSSTESAQLFIKLKMPFIAVFGNNDFNTYDLTKIIEPFGQINLAPYIFSIDDKSIMLSHYIVTENTKNINYVIYGHTHKAKIYKSGNTLFINPGEVCGYRYGNPSIAILNTDNDNCEIINLFND